ncbi:MAG: NAD-dependent epimerase/dehydratase family protein [Tetrasphaera sp.]
MRLLVTGGAGFIGSNLAVAALAEGHEVTVVDDLSTGRADAVPAGAQFIEASIEDRAVLMAAMDGVDAVVHLAALGSVPRSIANPVRSHAVNVDGTINVLEAARAQQIQHLVFSSSSSVYGLNTKLPKNERDWVRPMSPYAAGKLAAEQYVLAYQTVYSLRALVFRLFNVYGPGQRPGHAYSAVIPTFADRILRSEPVTINGDPQISRDFTYVGDVCGVLLDALRRRVTAPEPINLAFGNPTTLTDLIESLAAISRREATTIVGPPRTGDIQHSLADGQRVREVFPAIRPTPMDTGLSETLAWVASVLSKG